MYLFITVKLHWHDLYYYTALKKWKWIRSSLWAEVQKSIWFLIVFSVFEKSERRSFSPVVCKEVFYKKQIYKCLLLYKHESDDDKLQLVSERNRLGWAE